MTQETTAEQSVSKAKEEIIKEALRIEESLLYSSKGNFKAAALFGALHLVLGLPMVILAGITGASAFGKIDQGGNLAGFLSIVIIVLSSMTTFLNPNKRSSDHLLAGNHYDALLNKVRLFRTIDCWEQNDQVLSERIRTLSKEKSTLNISSPKIPWIAYRLAKRGIRKGEADYEVDK